MMRVRKADPPSAVGGEKLSSSPWTAFLTLTHNYPEELLGLKRLAP